MEEEDLAEDALTYVPQPYNPDTSRGRFWQCFSPKNVKNKYHTWTDVQGIGRTARNVPFCDLEIVAERDGQTQLFGIRRAKEVDFCRYYIKAWRKLTRGESLVCFSGEHVHKEKDKINGIEKDVHLWVWDKFKTHKGCYAYFGGEDCGTKEVISGAVNYS